VSRPPRFFARGYHAWLGLAWILGCQALLLAGTPFVEDFFTALVWWGYIVLVDGLVRRLRGRSLLVDAFPEFRNIVALSIPLWLVFEYYNLFLDNWHYVGLPSNPRVRFLGYAVAFASILPALIETADLIGGLSRKVAVLPPCRRPLDRRAIMIVIVGVAMLVGPLLFPSIQCPARSALVSRGLGARFARTGSAFVPRGLRLWAIVGILELLGRRQVDLHGAVPSRVAYFRDARARLPRLWALRAGDVRDVPVDAW